MTRQELNLEVVGQLRSRFIPSGPDIGKCIDLLIGKEFLEIIEGDFLGYLA